jgi:hypothetical protein
VIPVSDDSILDAAVRDAVELRLTTALRAALEQKAAFELEVLNARDHAAAQAAMIGELRHELRLASEWEIHDSNHRNHIARLEEALRNASREANRTDALRREIATMKQSRTWKVGRMVLRPVRALKRLRRRGD